MEWISVKDRLPEKDCICVIWNESRHFQYYISNYVHFFKEFEVWLIGASRINDPICFHATHWAELQCPKE